MWCMPKRGQRIPTKLYEYAPLIADSCMVSSAKSEVGAG